MNGSCFGWACFLLACTLAGAPVEAAVTETVVDVQASNGRARFLYVRPESPTAIVISVAGGDGILGIRDDGTMTTHTAACSPFARNRQAVARAGVALALVDGNANGTAPEYEDVAQVAAYLRARHNVPVWITGGSSSTGLAAVVAAMMPGPTPWGVLFFSPMKVAASLLGAIKRPAVIIYHSLDGQAFPASVAAGLTAAPAKESIALNGGSDGGCGYHLYNGLDAEFVAAATSAIAKYNPATVALAGNYQGLWWSSPPGSESGWGVNIAHQGDVLFATWFTYDAAGDGMWLVVPAARATGAGTYAGKIYRTTGPSFDAVPFDALKVVVTEVGNATFSFVDANVGTFQANVGSANVTKAITRQIYAEPVPRCVAGTTASAGNFQDLWWGAPGGSESGWGVNITHQGNVLFATWFTYGVDGKGRWFVMSEGRKQPDGSYAGTLYETRGPAFDAIPWNPAGVAVVAVGSAGFRFSGAASGTFSYVVNGVAQTKAITRQVYESPITACN